MAAFCAKINEQVLRVAEHYLLLIVPTGGAAALDSPPAVVAQAKHLRALLVLLVKVRAPAAAAVLAPNPDFSPLRAPRRRTP